MKENNHVSTVTITLAEYEELKEYRDIIKKELNDKDKFSTFDVDYYLGRIYVGNRDKTLIAIATELEEKRVALAKKR